MKKVIIFDASTLISFSMNGILKIIENLKEKSNIKFIIPLEVKYEVVDKPIKINRFKLEALKIQNLLKRKIIEMPESLDIKQSEVSNKTKEILKIANSIYKESGKKLDLIHNGEASCIALYKILQERKFQPIIAVDERTTRMLCESPKNLKELLEKKLHTKINYDKTKTKYFLGIKIIRSTELAYVAYKKGLTQFSGRPGLDALLHALKYKGCSISYEEIEEIKKIN